MRIVESLSHMPFLSGNTLYFCHSAGERVFAVDRTEIARRLGVPQQKVSYQPWQLARKIGDGPVELISVSGFEADSPSRRFCNPVFDDDQISFVYAGSLWVAVLDGLNAGPPILLRQNVSTGFMFDGVVVYAIHGCGGDSTKIVVLDGETPSEIPTPFDRVVRVIPHGAGAFLITGQSGTEVYSILRQPNGSMLRLKVAGEDVYKCCLSGVDIIHTVKGTNFEERHLHIDPVELEAI